MKNLSKSHEKLPSNEQILAKKAEFRAFAEQVAKGEIQIYRKETIADKLRLVKEELILLKGIPYSNIKAILKDQLNMAVGEDTLRQFCQQELGFDKKPSKQTA